MRCDVHKKFFRTTRNHEEKNDDERRNEISRSEEKTQRNNFFLIFVHLKEYQHSEKNVKKTAAAPKNAEQGERAEKKLKMNNFTQKRVRIR